LSRVLATLRRCPDAHTNISLDNNFFLDIQWWRTNLRGWNGVSFMEFRDHQNVIALDASTGGALDGGPGIGGVNFISGQFFKCGVPAFMSKWIICDLELFAHIIAIRLWGPEWSGMRVWGLTDSEPSELLLRHGRSRVDLRIQLARVIASLEHRLSFCWVSGPIRSADNVLPDCLSRWGDPERWDTFWRTWALLGVPPVERDVTPDMFYF
jgi:hypothetical protein